MTKLSNQKVLKRSKNVNRISRKSLFYFLEHAKSFSSASSHFKTSDTIRTELRKGLKNYMDSPAYIDTELHLNVFTGTSFIRVFVEVYF